VTKPQRQAIVVVVLCVLAACLLLCGFWTHGLVLVKPKHPPGPPLNYSRFQVRTPRTVRPGYFGCCPGGVMIDNMSPSILK
jgi:hypothetical protein